MSHLLSQLPLEMLQRCKKLVVLLLQTGGLASPRPSLSRSRNLQQARLYELPMQSFVHISIENFLAIAANS